MPTQSATTLQRSDNPDQRFRAAVDASADVIHIVDPETMRLVDANETACRHLGYTREEFLRLAIPDFSPGANLEHLRRTYEELFAGDEVAQRARIVHRHRDGRLIPMEIHRRGVVVDGRRLVVNVVRDMSEQAKAEQALRESEARFRSLTHLSSDWYWEQDADGRFTRIEGRNISPQAPGMIGKRRWETGLEIEGGWGPHRELIAQRKPFRDVLMWRVLEGQVRYIQVSGEPVLGSDGAFRGYRGVGRDVTEQKRNEQLLRLEHEVARVLSESDTERAALEAVVRALCETEGWTSGRYLELGQEGATRDAFTIPVVSEGRRLGSLRFSGAPPRDPDTRLLQATEVIGAQVGQFLQRIRAEAALRESETRFRSLTQMSSDFYWETDEDYRFTQVVHGKNFAERFTTVSLGKAAWEIPYTMPDEEGWARLRATLDARRDFRDFEFGRPTQGGARYLSVSGEPRHEGGRFVGYRGVGRDITDLVLARERIASLAYSDPLTGLANRASLVPAFEQALERARRRGSCLAALFIDLDGFKEVNDAWGHASGDAFLVETARRLRGGVRASDLVARLGGDEFFAVLEEVQGAAQVEAIAQKLLVEIARPVELAAGRVASVTGSIGVALFPDDAPDVAGLMQRADKAMYEAKQAGKNAVR